MVLTNFELWAADGSSATSLPLDFETNGHNRHLNPFDPRAVPSQLNNTNLTHLSSNGYYGFSYINAAHDLEETNNNNNTSNNNNNTAAYNFMANDVNGMNNTMTATTTTTPQTHAVAAINYGSADNTGAHYAAANITRCKKRFYVMNDTDDNVDCTATNKNLNGCVVSAKRCRFDDDFAAQYCNDFFSLPSTQIATQSCYMDTQEGFPIQQTPSQQHLQQQQVDVAMFENNNNNCEKFEQNLHLQLPHQQQQLEQSQNTILQSPLPLADNLHQQQNQQQPQQQQQQHLYHQQQHYQDMITNFKCHFNNSLDTITLSKHTCKIDSQNTENFLKSHNQNNINENVTTNDFKVDDATLFAQIHGGCLHHYVNNTNEISNSSNNKDLVKNYLQDDNYI